MFMVTVGLDKRLVLYDIVSKVLVCIIGCIIRHVYGDSRSRQATRPLRYRQQSVSLYYRMYYKTCLW